MARVRHSRRCHRLNRRVRVHRARKGRGNREIPPTGVHAMSQRASVAERLPAVKTRPRPSAQSLMLNQPPQHRLWTTLFEAFRKRLREALQKTPARQPMSYSSLLYVEPSALTGMTHLGGFGGDLTLYDVWPTPTHADTYALASDWSAVGNDLWQAQAMDRARLAADDRPVAATGYH